MKLPLDHPPEALGAAGRERLGVADADLMGFRIARRAHDARKKSAILMVYSVDAEVRDEAAILARGLARVTPTPDTEYRFATRAPE
ncbi:hypothetical protein, partial [Moraxella catarrhalis]|uniref:hypothetical protein n=1 Tax=Moraxella catarrhalis TaxID=480 RepID=UPI0022287C28